MPSIKPDTPVQADHRYIFRVVAVLLSDKVEYIPSEFSRISRVFCEVGGSWEKVLVGGSPSDISLLKRVIKAAYKNGFLTKKEKWV